MRPVWAIKLLQGQPCLHSKNPLQNNKSGPVLKSIKLSEHIWRQELGSQPSQPSKTVVSRDAKRPEPRKTRSLTGVKPTEAGEESVLLQYPVRKCPDDKGQILGGR